MKKVSKVYLGLGSNVSPQRNLLLAYQALSQLGKRVQCSKVYRSSPVGEQFVGTDEADFYNAAVELDTELSLVELYQQIKSIEKAHSIDNKRLFDIDILLFADEVNASKPCVPRQDIFKFAFVIQPLYELCPQKLIANDGRTVEQIWQAANNLSSLTEVELRLY